MFPMEAKYSVWLLLTITINLIVHYNSITECQSTSRRNQSSGINKNSNKTMKMKAKDAKNATKAKIDIESETQRAIDDLHTEVTTIATTLAIDQKNETNNNETEIQLDINWTSNQTSIINETDVTTPSIVFNISTNESFVTTFGKISDYINVTESELSFNSTQLSDNDINHTITPISGHNVTNPTELTEIAFSDNPTELSESLNESPVISSTISSTIISTDSSLDPDEGRTEELEKCEFDHQIDCKDFQLQCFGSGEVDCGHRRTRSVYNVTLNDNKQVFKSYLEKQSQSESIKNSKCVLTPFEGMPFACNPFPLIKECKGKSFCKPLEESRDVSEGIPIWKVGLIATLTAVGAVCFIIVAIIGYLSYNKLKVRPDSSINGSNRSQNVTRV